MMRKLSTIIWQYKRDIRNWFRWKRYKPLTEAELEEILNDPDVVDTVAENILVREFKL